MANAHHKGTEAAIAEDQIDLEHDKIDAQKEISKNKPKVAAWNS